MAATMFDRLFPPEPRPYSAYAPIRQRPRRTRGSRDDGQPLPPGERAAEVARIAAQLAKVAETVPWGRVQEDRWDGLTRFVYRVRSAASARARAEAVAWEHGPRLGLDRTPFVHYALRRWYCFWGARMAELLFQEHPGVRPGPPKDHEVDFTIDGVPFDLKTTELPRVFSGPIEAWRSDPAKLASWLYQNQSREGRFHAANRIFLVLCDQERPEEAWRLRADAAALRRAIGEFMARRRFLEIAVPDQDGNPCTALTAVVPVLATPGPRQMQMALGDGGVMFPALVREPAGQERLL